MSGAARVLGGRYRLDQLLGGGGFADVYLATDTGPLGRRVAVKLLHPHLTREQDFLDRFRREAATVALLKHPHILDVYDFGEQDGVPYLVMPYVAGGTLDDRLRAAGRLDPPQVAAYLRQAAGALDHAHQRRIVHRDLKPKNLLLDGDTLLLADFGIARLLQEASDASGGTAILGTLPYMAPELFRGQPGPASDCYALGCLAFQLLTGTTPFAGSTEQLMFAHSFEPVPSLAERGGGHLPAALGPVLARALAKRPEDRHASAGDFARAFDAALAGADRVATVPLGLPGSPPAPPAPDRTVVLPASGPTPDPTVARPVTPRPAVPAPDQAADPALDQGGHRADTPPADGMATVVVTSPRAWSSRWLRLGLGLAVATLAALVLAGFLISRRNASGEAVIVVPFEGQVHVNAGDTVAYKHYPPSSGPHYPTAQAAGIYQAAIAEGYWIHSLEHGYIVALVKCTTDCAAAFDLLRSIYAELPPSQFGNVKFIAVKYDGPFSNGKSPPVTLLAWTREQQLAAIDREKIIRFYRQFVDKGPELVP